MRTIHRPVVRSRRYEVAIDSTRKPAGSTNDAMEILGGPKEEGWSLKPDATLDRAGAGNLVVSVH